MAGFARSLAVAPFVIRRVAACAALAATLWISGAWAQSSDNDPPEEEISQQELRSELQRFALRFDAQMGQAIDELLAESELPRERRFFREAKAFYLTDLLQIALGPNPEVNLLDMVVYTTLNRIVLEEDIGPNLLGERADRLLDILRRLEQEIWQLTARAFTVEEQRELHAEIFRWRERNADIAYITGIRIGDFSQQFAASGLVDTARRGFLLPEVNAATAAVDQVRLLAERMFFFTQMLPLIMRSFAELTYVGALAEPETQKFLNNTTRVSVEIRRFNDTLEELTGSFDEARDALTLVMDELGPDGAARAALRETQEAIEAGSELAREVSQTSEDAGRAILSAGDAIEKLLILFPPTEPGEERTDLFKLLADTRTTAADLQQLADTINTVLTVNEDRVDLLINGVNRFDTAAKGFIDRAFFLGTILILILLVGGVVAALAYQWMRLKVIQPRARLLDQAGESGA